MRSDPRRFRVGVPVVFFGALGLGILLAQLHLSLGIALMLVVQTSGFLWLYVPALRRRLREEAGTGAGSVSPEEDAAEGPPTSE